MMNTELIGFLSANPEVLGSKDLVVKLEMTNVPFAVGFLREVHLLGNDDSTISLSFDADETRKVSCQLYHISEIRLASTADLLVEISYLRQQIHTPEEERKEKEKQEKLAKSVDELELSVRSYNCIKNARIRTIAQLVEKSEAQLLRGKLFGRKSINEIQAILGSMGLALRE